MIQTALIIENETTAVERLKRLLQTYNPGLEIIAVLNDIEGSVEWLQNHKEPELIFLDVELNDGLSLDIFKQVKINAPVIFTTSHREYAYDAFQVDGAAYLLKPFFYKALEEAIKKVEVKRDKGPLVQTVAKPQPSPFKSRFISRVNGEMTVIPTEKILYFEVRHRTVFCATTSNTSHQLDSTLEAIALELDPQKFFRLNRKYIASISAIEKVASYSSSRLAVTLRHLKKPILVGRDKSTPFKVWLQG